MCNPPSLAVTKPDLDPRPFTPDELREVNQEIETAETDMQTLERRGSEGFADARELKQHTIPE